MGRTTVLEGLTSRIEMGAGWEIHAPSTSLEDAMSRGRNTEKNPASGEGFMFRLMMASILVAGAVFGLIHTAIGFDTRIASARAEANPKTQISLPAF